MLTIGRLIAVCFGSHGLAGCICQVNCTLCPALAHTGRLLTHRPASVQFALTLQPEWRKRSTNKVVRCENGDPFLLILRQIEDLIVGWVEKGVNELVDGVNGIFDSLPWPLSNIGRPVPKLCFPQSHRPDKCKDSKSADTVSNHFQECENAGLKGGVDMLCYYKRVRAYTQCEHTSRQS